MIFDLHNDFATKLDPSDFERYLTDNARDGARITAVIWTSELGKNASGIVEDITAKLADIRASAPMPLAIEDIGFLSERDAYMQFDFKRYMYCSLTWNYDNGFAGGALDDGELTERGRRAIQCITKSGCMLDLAHLNEKSFYGALECADRAVCSHTGFYEHKRALDDNRIRELIAHNGLIGLCGVIAFTGADTAEKFSEVIDGFVQKYGADNLAIGTDFNGSVDLPSDLNEYKHFDRVAASLIRRGYAKKYIDKIFYGNAEKFFYRG